MAWKDGARRKEHCIKAGGEKDMLTIEEIQRFIDEDRTSEKKMAGVL